MGALVGALVQARRVADEETALVAEYYRDHPLLEGLTLPRVRVPEMGLDLPVVIEAVEEGEPGVPNDPAKIREAILKALLEICKQEEIDLSPTFNKQLDLELRRAFPDKKQRSKSKSTATRESAVRAMETAFNRTLSRKELKRELTPTQTKTILQDLRRKTGDVAMKKEGEPTRIRATIVTAEVKEKAGSGNVTRLRLTLKEEGLEWTTIENEDGTSSRKLTPE